MHAPAEHPPACGEADSQRTMGILVCWWKQRAHLADELDVLSLDVLHHHDLHLIEEMQGEVAQRVSAVEEQGERRASGVHVPGVCTFAYRRMDFWMSSTLQPAFLICLTMLRM